MSEAEVLALEQKLSAERSAVEERLLKKLFALQDSAAVPALPLAFVDGGTPISDNPRCTITYPAGLDAVLSADLRSVLALFGSSFYGLTSTKAAEALAGLAHSGACPVGQPVHVTF